MDGLRHVEIVTGSIFLHEHRINNRRQEFPTLHSLPEEIVDGLHKNVKIGIVPISIIMFIHKPM